MKNWILFLIVLLPVLLFAQTEGVVKYTETIALQIELPEGMEEFASQIPSSQTVKQVLYFNENQALFKNDDNQKTEDTMEGGSEESGVQFRMDFQMPEHIVFCDLKEGKITEKQDFMGKTFLIKGEMKKYKWKMTGEQKKILDYPCMKATYEKDSTMVVAWFTPQIPVSAGPSRYTGLPGMILEMEFNDGQRKVVATEVELKALEKDTIVAPKKGKKVTHEEYKKIQEEKMKELEQELGGSSGGSGTRIIIRGN